MPHFDRQAAAVAAAAAVCVCVCVCVCARASQVFCRHNYGLRVCFSSIVVHLQY